MPSNLNARPSILSDNATRPATLSSNGESTSSDKGLGPVWAILTGKDIETTRLYAYKTRYTIGRGSTDIRVKEGRFVSRWHATISWNGDGIAGWGKSLEEGVLPAEGPTFYVMCRGKNRLEVRGERVAQGLTTHIKYGNTIVLCPNSAGSQTWITFQPPDYVYTKPFFREL